MYRNSGIVIEEGGMRLWPRYDIYLKETNWKFILARQIAGKIIFLVHA